MLGAANAARGTDARGARHIVAAIDRSWFAEALAWLRVAQLPADAVFAGTDTVSVAPGEWAVVIAGSHGFARRDDGYAYSLDTTALEAPPLAMVPALGEGRV